MSCNKLVFWSGHCNHSGIKKKISTASKKKAGGIALASSLSEPMKGQKKALMQKSGKIMLESVPKKGMKEIPTGRGSPHTNSDICRPKEGVTPRRRILTQM